MGEDHFQVRYQLTLTAKISAYKNHDNKIDSVYKVVVCFLTQ